MNWVTALCDLYEKNESIAGKYGNLGKDEKKPLMLLPLSHATVLAQIEVSINEQGDFLRARKLTKEEALTLIPVSESSAIRTSGPVPHPLMDTLPYCAGDYDNCIRAKIDEKTGKPKIESFRGRYDEFISNLEDWCVSKYTHRKAISILAYLKKACLTEDLIREQVLLVDTDGLLKDTAKIQGNILQEKAFIRFRVENSDAPDLMDDSGSFSPEVWKDTTLQKSYIDYFKSQPANIGLCYLSGNTGTTTNSFPKKIRHDGDGAKMLSSNDNDGFTFRGRFNNSNEAFSIGYESSQKAHNALNWIIRKQGYMRNGLCVVSWETDLKPYVPICGDAADAIQQALEEDIYGESGSDDLFQQDTNYVTAVHFNKALDGFAQNVSNSSNMVIMALDAATQGRLAITYFNRMPYSRYIENIAFWHESCRWRHAKFINKKLVFYEGMASMYDISLALFGSEQEKLMKLKTDQDGKSPLLVETFQRLAPCMLERKRIPRDMEKIAVMRASSPLAYEKNNWRRISSIACSIVKKTKFDWKGEKWHMALENDCTDRSYLYGRLLAVADRAEEATYDKEEDKRETNAMRYMNAFSRRPFRTWKIIEENLQSYYKKLPIGSRIFFKNLLNEIQKKFDSKMFSDDSALDGLYLLGFHSQMNVLFTKKEAVSAADIAGEADSADITGDVETAVITDGAEIADALDAADTLDAADANERDIDEEGDE